MTNADLRGLPGGVLLPREPEPVYSRASDLIRDMESTLGRGFGAWDSCSREQLEEALTTALSRLPADAGAVAKPLWQRYIAASVDEQMEAVRAGFAAPPSPPVANPVGEAMFNALGRACIKRIFEAKHWCDTEADVLLRLESIIRRAEEATPADDARDAARLDLIERLAQEDGEFSLTNYGKGFAVVVDDGYTGTRYEGETARAAIDAAINASMGGEKT